MVKLFGFYAWASWDILQIQVGNDITKIFFSESTRPMLKSFGMIVHWVTFANNVHKIQIHKLVWLLDLAHIAHNSNLIGNTLQLASLLEVQVWLKSHFAQSFLGILLTKCSQNFDQSTGLASTSRLDAT